jgi:hypothetical protein
MKTKEDQLPFFQKNKNLISIKENSSSFIEKINEFINIKFNKIDKAINLDDAITMNAKRYGEWMMNRNEGYSFYVEFKKNQIELLKSKTQEFQKFVNTKHNGYSLIELNEQSFKLKLEIARLLEVIYPQVSKSEILIKKKNKKYIIAKAEYWDDFGIRSRSFIKSLRKTESTVTDKLIDIYKLFGFKENIPNYELKNNSNSKMLADLLIIKGKIKYVVEVKTRSLDEIEQFIMEMAMWDHFEKQYINL